MSFAADMEEFVALQAEAASLRLDRDAWEGLANHYQHQRDNVRKELREAVDYWDEECARVQRHLQVMSRELREERVALERITPVSNLLRELNQARSLLRDAEDETTHSLTTNAKFIDQRVTEAREAVDRAIHELISQEAKSGV